MHFPLFLTSGLLLASAGSGAAQAVQPAATSSAAPVQTFPEAFTEGAWIGDLGAGGDSPLRIVLRLRKTATGGITGTMDSPDQGVDGLPVDEVSTKDSEVLARVNAVNGLFRGKLSAEGKEWRGTWSQGLPLPLTLRWVALAPQSARPWAPALLATELDGWEADLSTGTTRVDSAWKFPALVAREGDWLETPLPPATRLRLGNAGGRLLALAPEMPEGKRGGAFHLAASFLRAAGRSKEALEAARAALRLPGPHDATTYLVEELEARRDGRHAKKIDEIDVAARRFRARNRIPGVALAVVRDGQVIKSSAYGFANLELKAAATPETVFELGSITKQFTATGIMMLAEEGKLRLDDKIRDRLPNLPEAWSGVTLRHLLTHTSGIKNYTNLPAFATGMSREYTPSEIIALVAKLPLDFQPGDKFSYCNTGYYLLGMVIERISSKSLAEFLAERIFRARGMNSTRVNSFTDVVPNRATGYSWAGDHTTNAALWPISGRAGAGSLVSTVLDMAKWDAALYGEKLLKRASLEEMWKPVRLNNGSTAGYGYGWGTTEYRGHRLVAHSGGLPGWSSDIARFPDDRLTVIVLTNRDGVEPARLSLQIADLSLPLGDETTADSEAERTVQSAIRSLVAGKTSAGVTDGLVGAQGFGTREDTATFLRGLGPLRSVQQLAIRTDENGMRRFRFRATFAKVTWIVAAAMPPKETRVSWLALQPE